DPPAKTTSNGAVCRAVRICLRSKPSGTSTRATAFFQSRRTFCTPLTEESALTTGFAHNEQSMPTTLKESSDAERGAARRKIRKSLRMSSEQTMRRRDAFQHCHPERLGARRILFALVRGSFAVFAAQ